MQQLDLWARKWGIAPEALNDLKQQLGTVYNPTLVAQAGESEAAVQTRVRLEASRKGLRLFRNNVGATVDDRGNHIRYGLANESVQMNRVVKSSDLIGIRSVLIQSFHVGTVMGQFVAREVKAGGWKYRGNKHEEAQLAFINLINAMGGDAAFCNTEGTL